MLVYAADSAAAAHDRCRHLLQEWRAQAAPWYLTWSVLYEFLRVVTHPRVFRRPWGAEQAWQFVESVLASPSAAVLSETDRHEEIVRELLHESPWIAGNLFHDMHVVAVMRGHGIKSIYTRDSDFHRFPGIEVIDPLRGG